MNHSYQSISNHWDFYISSENIRIPLGFLLSRGIERDQWNEMGYTFSLFFWHQQFKNIYIYSLMLTFFKILMIAFESLNVCHSLSNYCSLTFFNAKEEGRVYPSLCGFSNRFLLRNIKTPWKLNTHNLIRHILTNCSSCQILFKT